MANDFQHFRTGGELEKKGCRREGNVYCGRDGRYLPLYEAKMLPPIRSSLGDLPDSRTTRAIHRLKKSGIPGFLAQPHFWVREGIVEVERFRSIRSRWPPRSGIGHRPSIQCVLLVVELPAIA